ncbi:MAG: hypothetical protein OXG52_03125 [bacterium]|nr:hypothetical protein [bacterium]MCY3951884.1 hypothetical protein [bacterium]
MHEHEVPTHVQAEDRVLLWFTFPQIVALTAVGALAYGASRVMPIGSSELRLAIAVVLGLFGLTAVVGRIGGRRLPLVAADLLRFWLGPRRYAGTQAELLRSHAPPPTPAASERLRLLPRRVRRGLRRRRKRKARRRERRLLRPRSWFGKRWRNLRRKPGNGRPPATRKPKRGKGWGIALAIAALATVPIAVPPVALADEPWQDEIEFEMPAPVPGRRLFVEGLAVAGDRATVTLRAATDLELQVRAYGDRRQPSFTATASLAQGARVVYRLPLAGTAPSLAFAWKDARGQAGAVTLQGPQLPYPLPVVEGEICDARVVALSWQPDRIEGVLAADCVATIDAVVDLPTSDGHHAQRVTAVREAEVTDITGTVALTGGGARASATFVPNGETKVRLPVTAGRTVHRVTLAADVRATLEMALPPLIHLTHHPERIEARTATVRLERPGTSRTVSEIVTVTHAGGTTTQHTVAANLEIPSTVVDRDVTLTIVHPEHVRAEVVEREPITRDQREALALTLRVGSDAPYRVLNLPPLPPGPEPAAQTRLSDEQVHDLFNLLGWRWPW